MFKISSHVSHAHIYDLLYYTLAHISRDCNTKELAYNSLIKTFEDKNYKYQHLRIKTLDKEEILQGGHLDEKNCLVV